MATNKKKPNVGPGMPCPVLLHLDHVQAVIDAVQEATPYETISGMLWYPLYAYMIQEANPHNSFEVNSGIFAVLSPQRAVKANWDTYMKATNMNPWEVPTIMLERFKLAGILGSGSVQDYLSGEKVTSFYNNLNGFASCATIDRHAASVVLNRHITGAITPTWYRYLDSVYRSASVVLCLTTMETQAIAWTVQKRRKQSPYKDPMFRNMVLIFLRWLFVKMHQLSKKYRVKSKAA